MMSSESNLVVKYVGVFLLWGSCLLALVALISNGLTTRPATDFLSKLAFGSSSGQFTLSSPAFNDGEYLPDEYSCLCDDGIGVSPPLEWSNVPDGTQQFFITMTSQHDESSCKRFEWTLYDISGASGSLDADTSLGSLGGSYPGDPKYEYASPCSSGMGDKTYTFKIYALSVKLSEVMKTSDVVGPAIVTTVEAGEYVLGTASITALFNHGIPPAPLPALSSLRRLAQVAGVAPPPPVAAVEEEEEEGSSDDEYCIKV